MATARNHVTVGSDRRKTVEAALAAFARRPTLRRVAPPEGRLGPGDFPIRQLRIELGALGPVFASFGRYLATRPDLLSRRDCVELALIPDTAPAADAAALAAQVQRQLGAPPNRRFFQFEDAPRDITLWTQRHHAWVAPGVPVIVTIARPDAADWLETDLPLLPLLQRALGIEPIAYADALVDFAATLRQRLDQSLQAASLSALAVHTEDVGGFAAPPCYRDHCAAGVLTQERWDGTSVADAMAPRSGLPDSARTELAQRIASAWLRQALAGRVLPFDFAPRDIVVSGERLLLTGAAFDPLGSVERARFSRYLSAVAADDPESSAAWIIDAPGTAPFSQALEEEVRRRFRQAVPFRDGEWSGDDRLAENVFVQWRVAREAGWRLTPQRLHAYRGMGAVAAIGQALAPHEDTLLSGLQRLRLQRGMSEAASMLDPMSIGTRLDTALREMVTLPQKLDEVLTLASEGRLRVKLQVPETGDGRRQRQQTILMLAMVVLLAAMASLVRHIAPGYGPGVERLGVMAMLVVGGWLLIAAARL